MTRAAVMFAALLLATPPVSAVDMAGADLTPANYDTLSGTYTSVGNFTIPAGATVFVGQGTGLFIYASTVTIDGHLNANGRGEPGGYSGEPGFAGGQGFGRGKGGAGGVGLGGGGGGYGDADSNGVSGGAGGVAGGGGAAGLSYNSTAAVTVPFSADDISMGSGGGGGGGGAADTTSGAGGSGGGLIYIEADYVVITGTVSANGLAGGTGIDVSGTSPGGGGGGGSGGAIAIISRGSFSMPSGGLFSEGGLGGTVLTTGGGEEPGGGGAGGRVNLVYNSFSGGNVFFSTSGASGGQAGFVGGYAATGYGSSGTVSVGVMPSSPTGLAFTGVFMTSAAYSWTGMTEADFGGPLSMLPSLTTMQLRLFSGTGTLPFSASFTGVSASSNSIAVEEGTLIPDTTIYRFLTAYTDLGDSAASLTITTRTWAAPPVAAQSSAFVGLSSYSLSVAWSSGTVATGFNPSHTSYELSFSSSASFDAPVSTGFLTGISSAPANLQANTTYYLRVRALGINGAYTSFAQTVSTPTMAAPPYAPAFSQVHVSSAVLVWNSAGNPDGTLFEAQLSVDNFVTVSSAPLTTATTAYFGNMSPGTVYTARVRALNRASVPTAFSISVSTTPGSLGNLEAPGKPEPPQPASPYSYDGTAVFNWAPPAGAVPIYEYILELGTLPGGSDLGTDSVLASGSLSYSTNTLVSGKTYYARVRAKSAAGVLGEFSAPGRGVQVWITASEAAIVKPYNWPNPFDPAVGATNIGFNLAGPATVTLRIFTLQGREVWSRSAYESSGGNKVWTWTGRNGSGSTVEPGGYAVMITKDYSGGGSQTQKFKLAVLY